MSRIALLLLSLLIACTKPPETVPPPDPATVHRDLLVIDTHIDIPYRLADKPADISERLDDGDFDFVRAKEGGLDASFFSIYVASEFNAKGTSPDAKGGAWQEAQRILATTDAALVANAALAVRVGTPEALRAAAEAGLHAVVYGLENGAPLEGDLGNLQRLHDAGVRYITLTHSKDNHICDSSYDDRHTHGGLTAFGKSLIPEMNRLGILIDVSHVSDDTFWQVLELTAAPVIASHSGLRHFHDMERNVSDEMLKALKRNGGVLHMNFGTYFLSGEVAKKMKALKQEIKDAMAAAPTPEEGEKRAAALEAGFAAHNLTVSDVVDQIDYAVKAVGADHVGLGSDFDGVYFTPKGLEDVSDYPAITAALLARGYSPEVIAKISGGNLLRVWRQNLAVAARLSAKPH